MVGDTLVVYRHEDSAHALGPAVLLAAKHRAAKLVVLVGDDGSVLARQASQLSPFPVINKVVGTDLEPVGPSKAGEGDQAEALALHVLDQFRADFEAHGLTMVVEQGRITAELLGLEIARVVEGELQVGIGRFDREAGVMLRGTAASPDVLADAIEQVAPHRSSSASPHPLNRLCRERWLRQVAIANPATLGLTELHAIATVEPRLNLLDPWPAAAIGSRATDLLTADETVVLVVFSAGIDPQLLSFVADLLARHDPTDVMVVLPERDIHPTVVQAMSWLRVPVEMIAVAPPWPSGTS
ncbi:MAG: hypothetical protein V3V01_18995 [Acidimicrobiales bacterium]